MNECNRFVRFPRGQIASAILAACAIVGGSLATNSNAATAGFDAKAIKDTCACAMAVNDGIWRMDWARTDVEVTVDGMKLPPAAGLGSWAAFMPMKDGAMVMGDTVVFEDEVDAAMDAAFAHGLQVTGLHNHFFHDSPHVYFMHIGGEGKQEVLAEGVNAVWAAIRAVRSAHPQPAVNFGSDVPSEGHVDPIIVGNIVGQPAKDIHGVAKITIGRNATMHGMQVGGSMGLTTWAAFSGSDALAAMDGDFMMTAQEVQPVLHALRKAGIHVVALHNHMLDVHPDFYFTHFWGTGKAADLARGFRAALDAQAAVKKS